MSLRVQVNGDYWQAVYNVEGRKIVRSLGRRDKIGSDRKAMDAAIKMLAERGIVIGQRPESVTVQQWSIQYQADRADLDPTTLAAHAKAMDVLIGLVGASTRISDIGPEHARRLVNHLRSQPGMGEGSLMSAETITSYVRRLSTVFDYALNRGTPLVARNPFSRKVLRAQTLALASGNAAWWRPLELPEFWRIAERIANQTAHNALLLARLAGMRHAEIKALRWQDFNWDRSFVTVRVRAKASGRFDNGTKQHERTVPMEPTLALMMLRAHEASNDNGPARDLARYHTDLIHKARRECGISEYGKPLHACRASCATDWFHRFPAEREALAEAIGDSVETIMRHYYQRFPTERLSMIVRDDAARMAFLTHQSSEKLDTQTLVDQGVM